MNQNILLDHATKAMMNAYSPYSHFKVGSSVMTKTGKTFSGCNIENASYGGTICAERVAISNAIAAGEREIACIAIVSSSNSATFPCGLCRQFMAEFNLNLKIILQDNNSTVEISLKDLLPNAFTSFSTHI